MKLPATGGCICGAVRYEITQDPLMVYACHCTQCQRITSSAFSIGVIVPDTAFQVTAGRPKRAPDVIADSGRRKSRWICMECGTWLFGNSRPATEWPGMIRVIRGGTLDDASWLRPIGHYWTRSKHSWIVLPEDVMQFATQPDQG